MWIIFENRRRAVQLFTIINDTSFYAKEQISCFAPIAITLEARVNGRVLYRGAGKHASMQNRLDRSFS